MIFSEDEKSEIQTIADNYGWNAQCMMAIEEAAELEKAICKRQRIWAGNRINESNGSPERSEILEEIADMQIMLEQLTYLLSGEDEVSKNIDLKLNRQLQRINDDKF